MARILVLYGTTEGQTRKIAECIAARARLRGHAVELVDSAGVADDLATGGAVDPETFDAVILAGSVHRGRHQAALSHYARAHAAVLGARPSALVSVSLSAASPEPQDQADARQCADALIRETGWQPTATHLAAGALRYTQYDFFKRWAMKWIASQKGAPTDTTHDYEYTDWLALEGFVDGFLETLSTGAGAAEPA